MNSEDNRADDNPFASPQDTRTPVPVASVESYSSKYLCDGTGYNALEKGWKLSYDQFLPLLGVIVLHEIIRFPCDHLDNMAFFAGAQLPPLGRAFMFIYSIFLGIPISVGALWVFVKAAREESFAVDDMFAAFRNCYWVAVGGSLLKGIAILVGLVILIVPGLYLMIRLTFVEFLIIDRRMTITDAFRESWRLTEKYQYPLWFLFFMSILIEIGGLLLCYVGTILAGVWLTSAYAIFYITVLQHELPKSTDAAPEPDSENSFSN